MIQGLAYIDFSDDDHLAAAVAKNKQKLFGKKLNIARSDPKRSQKRDSASSNLSTTHKIPFGECFFVFVFNFLHIEINSKLEKTKIVILHHNWHHRRDY